MKRMLAKLVLSPLSGLALTLVLAAQGVQAQTPAETAAYQATLAEQMDAFVRERVAAYFKEVGLPPPEAVQVETHGAFTQTLEGEGGQAQGQVASVQLAVTLTTDQPSAIVREVRQHLTRGLGEKGYRLETAADQVVTVEPADTRPLATLTVTTIEPAPSPLKLNETREYVTFGAILLLLVLSLILLFYLLVLPWRRRRRPLAAIVPEVTRTPQILPDLPEIAVHMEAVKEAPPPPPSQVPPTPLTMPSPASTPLDPETLALRQMPFEKVLDLLIAAGPAERRVMIDRLDLNPPLKRRLEKELLAADLPPEPPLPEPV